MTDFSQAGGRGTLPGTRVFALTAGTTTINLVCFIVSGFDTETAFAPTITALFAPAP